MGDERAAGLGLQFSEEPPGVVAVFTPSSGSATFMLASSAWQGGAASCTATLENWDSYGTRGKVSTLASTSFDVSG